MLKINKNLSVTYSTVNDVSNIQKKLKNFGERGEIILSSAVIEKGGSI